MPETTSPSAWTERGRQLLDLVDWQVAFGHRYPGSEGHTAFRAALEHRLRETGLPVHPQRFRLTFRGKRCQCANYVVQLNPDSPCRRGPLLVGTHFDTRVRADRERDPAVRESPIPGANDGGSGTAVLLHLLETLRARRLPRQVLFAFFDAEDVGDIDGHPFSVGAARLAADPVPFAPEQVLVLDMIGGADMVLDVDAHAMAHPPSRDMTREVFSLAASLGMTPFTAYKQHKTKHIISDQRPFMERGTAACLLIDIDYPQWHTHADLPDAMSGTSLEVIEDFLLAYLYLT